LSWCRQLWPVPIALGLVIPTWLPCVCLALGRGQPSCWFARWSGRLWPHLYGIWHVADKSLNGPGQRFLVAINGIVVRRVLATPLTLFEIVAIAVHAIGELTQHRGIHPAVAFGLAEEPGLQLVQYPVGLVHARNLQRHRMCSLLRPFPT